MMDENWASNRGARRRVRNLLESAGIPLQAEVANICRRFCETRSAKSDLSMSTERIVYTPTGEVEIYREVDQMVYIYEEFEVDKYTGIQLLTNIPIECKYREDIEVFGFPSEHMGRKYNRFPLSADIAGSKYFYSLTKSYSGIERLGSCDITLMKIKDAKTPDQIYTEQVIYNAGGSLYDWVMFCLNYYTEDVEPKWEQSVEELYKEFESYLDKYRYDWSSVLRRWMNNRLDLRTCEEYNKEIYGEKRVYQMIEAYLPVICMNGSINKVSVDSDINVKGFRQTSSLASRIRKAGWPGRVENKLLQGHGEVPVLITNRKGLERVLEIGYSWHQRIKELLIKGKAEDIMCCHLEADFFQKVCHEKARYERTPYRSDFDIMRGLVEEL